MDIRRATNGFPLGPLKESRDMKPELHA